MNDLTNKCRADIPIYISLIYINITGAKTPTRDRNSNSHYPIQTAYRGNFKVLNNHVNLKKNWRFFYHNRQKADKFLQMHVWYPEQ